MKDLLVGFVVLMTIFFAAPALAAGPFYVGANYATVKYEVSDWGFLVDFDMTALVVNAGLNLNDYFAIEGRIGTGLKGESWPGLGPEIDMLYGVYARGEYPMQNFKPYLVLGHSWLEVDYDAILTDDSDNISYGIGADFKFADKYSINLEYLYLLEMDLM